MGVYNKSYIDLNTFIKNNRKPNFENILKVLKKEVPARPTLFEFFMNDELYKALTSNIKYNESEQYFNFKRTIDAFSIAGYDYVTIYGSDFGFPSNRHQGMGMKSISLNDGCVIYDRESFESYNWPDPYTYDYSRLETLSNYLPEGMKFIIWGPGGVLENVIQLVGYENLCFMINDDPDLAKEIFDAVGSRLVDYYIICSDFASVGALISNDDWGFNTQTMLSVKDMRKYVIPWHKKIVEVIHNAGKPAILHSCGNLELIMDDIIYDIKYDAKHSYEDNIMPVEKSYDKYCGKIATLGGMDLDFICRSTPEQVYQRASLMLEKSRIIGGYALGSGNSIPYYVPIENYLAMIAAAVLE